MTEMMMAADGEYTPGSMLGLIREDIDSWEGQEPLTIGEHQAAERMTRHFALLDAALKDGAAPPGEWARQPAEDVHWKCSVRINEPCTNEAAEVLVVHQGSGTAAYLRCAEHPGADMMRLVSRIDPWTQCVVLPLSAATAATQVRDDS